MFILAIFLQVSLHVVLDELPSKEVGLLIEDGLVLKEVVMHYNNRGLYCDPNIIANNKERSFRKPVVANHNSSQNLKFLRYHNIRTRTIAGPSQLPKLIQPQNLSDYNCLYTSFTIHSTSEIICSKTISATT